MAGWFMKLYKPLFLALLLVTAGYSQTVYVPLSHWIYPAIERWEAQGLIEYAFDHTRPFTRVETAEYIASAYRNRAGSAELANSDRQFLEYAAQEFAEELQPLMGDDLPARQVNRLREVAKSPVFDRLLPDIFYRNNRNFLSTKQTDFRIDADLIGQFSQSRILLDNDTLATETEWSSGALFHGSIGTYLGFYFMLVDNHPSRDPGYPLLEVLEESGLPYHTIKQSESFDYDENAAYLNLSHKYFNLMFGRDYNQWGAGHSGQMMLSTNAPIYDQVKLTVRYGRFKYTHMTAWLQYIAPEARVSIKAVEPVDVFWAGNRFEVYLGKGIQLGLAENIVYGDQSLKPGYLNPLAFYKSMEHYYGDRDNGALAIDLAWRFRPGMQAYGEWFLDDLTSGKIGTDFFGNKFGFQGGFFWVNPLTVGGSDLRVEYTRIKPYVYTHSVEDYNKYKHYDTVLGHRIGPNSDLWHINLRYFPHRRLMLQGQFENYRHGSNPDDRNVGGDPDLPFRFNVDNRSVTFLDGEKVTRRQLALQARFELLRNTYLSAELGQIRATEGDSEAFYGLQFRHNFGQRDESLHYYQPARR